jgi:hypothetical protein
MISYNFSVTLCKQQLIRRVTTEDRRVLILDLTEKGRTRVFQLTGRDLKSSVSIPI